MLIWRRQQQICLKRYQPIVDQGGGSYTLAQLQGAGFINAVQKMQIESGLQLIGINQDQIDAMNLAMIQGAYQQASPEFQQQATMLTGTAASLQQTSGQLSNKEVNTEQTGAGFTPILGINISPNEDWNIAVKYEHKTYLTLKNKPKADDNYSNKLFGHNVNSDIPGILGIGVGFKGLSWLEAQVSYNMYFNKGVDWGPNTRDYTIWGSVDQTKVRTRMIDKNGYEIGLGLQFNLSDDFAFSVGGLYGDMGVAPSYQSDFSYSNPSFTPGAGIMWKITDQLKLDAGVSNTFYQDQTVTFEDPDVPSYNDIYGKTTLTFAIGLSYSIY